MDPIKTLFDELKAIQASKKLPPVHQWQPENEGEIDIRIDRDGCWHHQGRLIERTAIARVFSTILRLDGNDYFLVTPQEKLKIEVEDVPFLVTDAQTHGAGAELEIVVSTSMDDHVVLSENHPLTMRGDTPYVEIRAGLLARVARSVYYNLVELGRQEASTWCLYSSGARFELGPV